MEIALSNCRKIFDPSNKMEKDMLYEFLDNGSLNGGKITLISFIINTCNHFFENNLKGDDPN
jgi:hypothetical protein